MIADAERLADHIERDMPRAVIARGRPDRLSLRERMAQYKVPGLTVALVNEGRVVFARSYGQRSAKTTERVEDQTLFQAASISKPVAAFAALVLADQGKLDLDADVNTVLKSWQVPENELMGNQRVTARRIMSHTAGLTMHGVWGYAPGEALPSTVQILEGAPPTNEAVRVTAEPGSEFRYSGGGYTVLQLLISEISGRPFEDFARTAVLEPCGMLDSTFAQPLPPQLEDRAASGHTGMGTVVPGRWTVLPATAAGGLWTTATDLARFAIETQRALTGRSAVLSAAMAEQMLAPQPVGPASLGFWVQGQDASARFFHAGSNVGYQAKVDAYLHGGCGAAVMTNGDGGASVYLGLLNRIAEVCEWPDYIVEKDVASVDPGTLDRYTGEYEIAGMPVTLTREDDALVVSAPLFVGGRLYPESETRFFYSDLDGGVTFEPDDRGRTVLTLQMGSVRVQGTRR